MGSAAWPRIAKGFASGVVWSLGLAATAAPACGVVKPDLAPRPVSGAERRAVALVVEATRRGADAFVDALSPASPLAALGKETAREEIAVRIGPTEGARWVLSTPGVGEPEGTAVFVVEYPSGLEETVTLRLDPETGRLRSLRILADPAPLPDASLDLAAESAPTAPSDLRAPLVVGLLLVATALAARRPVRRALPWAALVALACGRNAPPEVAVEGRPIFDPAELQRIASLAPLRAAIAGGADAATVERLVQAVPRLPEGAYRMSRLWHADHLLRHYRLTEADEILADFSTPSPFPQAELLRARLALLRLDPAATSMGYEWARTVGADHEQLRLEAAYGALAVGEATDGEIIFTQLAEMGSREASTYYGLARFALVDGETETATGLFRTGWELEPLERETLFADPLLASLATHEKLFPLFELGSVEQPAVARSARERDPIEVPVEARVSITGDLVRIELAGTEILLPGGGRLAPAGALVETAGAMVRRRESEALERLRGQADADSTAALFTLPAQRRSLEIAVAALARQRRWQEIADLTAGVSSHPDLAPPDVVTARAEALVALLREREAIDLLVDLVKRDRASQRRDPGSYFRIAEILAQQREYDLAVRLLRRADALAPLTGADRRIRQIEMEQRLAAANLHLDTPHFRIRHPASSEPAYVEHVAYVLEEEWKRLQTWIPTRPDHRVEVDLYPADEFFASYAGNLLVLGIYDGKVRVPLAHLRGLGPELVSILTHEVAHALVADRTLDRAPKWFHEGLAQHVQMTQEDVLNPVPDLAPADRLLAFPVVEAVLDGFAEPQFVELAYQQAAWTVHYVESRHGVEAIHRLLAAFADGKSSEEALATVLALEPATFDAAFWDWGATAPRIWRTRVRRYDKERRDALLAGAADPDAPRIVRYEGADGVTDMDGWYEGYRRRADAVRPRLAEVVRRLRDPQGSPREACRGLEPALRGILDDPVALQTPNAWARRHLSRAYGLLYQMARSCREGRLDEARRDLAAAEAALGAARQALGVYGLEP